MIANAETIVAVITGDFIGFSDLPADVRQKMYFILKDSGARLSGIFPEIMPYELDVFRGDGWQILLTNPVVALRSALFLRACIKARAPVKTIDSRLAIGVGPIDYVPDNRVSAGDGAAFRLSGKMIEQMTSLKSGTMRFVMKGGDEALFFDAIVRLAGGFADMWTARQSLAVTGALQNWSREQISTLWKRKISSRAVGNHLQRANWYAVAHGVRVFEEGMGRLLGHV